MSIPGNVPWDPAAGLGVPTQVSPPGSVRAKCDTEKDAISCQEPEKEQEEVRAPAGGGSDGRHSHGQLWPLPGHDWKLVELLAGMAGWGLT